MHDDLELLRAAVGRAGRRHKREKSTDSRTYYAVTRARYARVKIETEAAKLSAYIDAILSEQPPLSATQRERILNAALGA
jgi:hypothetical protein